MRRLAAAIVVSVTLGAAAHAAVPVNDGAVLNKRSEDSALKVQIKSISEQVQKSTKGIGCATTTPNKNTSVTSPTKTPEAGKGAATLERADPTISTSPAFTPPSTSGTGTTGAGAAGQGGWTAAPRAERAQTGQVIGGMETVQEKIQPNRQVFETMGRQVGTDATIMEAMDRNSAIRTQTGLTFNQAIQGTSYLAQAFNLANLATAAMTSQASRGLTMPLPTGPAIQPQTMSLCPAGMIGQGTAASPCVAAACSTTAYGTTPVPGCVARRTVDTTGNVSFLIEAAQTSALATPSTLSADELMAAVSQYERR